MPHAWYESGSRRLPLGIGAVLVVMLAVHLMTGYQMVAHEPPAPLVIEPSEQLADVIISASGWTLDIQPDGDGFAAIATRGDDRLVASGATRDDAADAVARKVAVVP